MALDIYSMGHSFTTFREKHIRSKDYKVETWLFLIVKEARKMVDAEPWLRRAILHWEKQATMPINGCIDPDLDQFITDDHKSKVLRTICQKIITDLKQFGDKIPKEYLNELCGYKPPNWIMEDNDTELYLVYGRALHGLLGGRQDELCKEV